MDAAAGSSSSERGSSSSSSRKRVRESDEHILSGRLGAASRGSYVIVVACECPAYPDYGCNCHVTIFWKDELGGLHRDCEEMFKAELDVVLDEQLDVSKDFLRMCSPVQPTPHTVDSKVWDLAHLENLRSEFWCAVRIYLEACAHGVGRCEELPKALLKWLQRATPGTVIRLQRGEAAVTAAIDAIGGEWPEGREAPALTW